VVIIQGTIQAEEGGTSSLIQRIRSRIGALHTTVVHNGVQGVGSCQGKVSVKASQSDITEVVERGKAEFHMKESDRRIGRAEIGGRVPCEDKLIGSNFNAK
jgi:hypothetical protein